MSTSATSGTAAGADQPSCSASTIFAVRGSHLLKIDGYTGTRMALGNGKHVKSGGFYVGGRTWHILYYPNGSVSNNTDSISLYLLVDGAGEAAVDAQFTFSLVDGLGKPVPSCSNTSKIRTFSSSLWGYEWFMKREDLEKSEHLRFDSFTIRCDVTVVKEPYVEEPFVHVPPPDLHDHLGHIRRSKEGTDVTFEVDGEMFAAHRCMLAARSPVFRAQLFGSMKEKTLSCIKIDDMEAQVFDILLQFIYTDALPEMDGQEKEEVAAMAQHLLVAADRYGMERLKLICEDELCMHIDRNTVATMLVLAEQHHCDGLKKACFKFLTSSQVNLNAVVGHNDFEGLSKSCPSVVRELLRLMGAKFLT